MLIALLKTMRPRQWPKNGFLFVALIFDRQLFSPTALLHTLAGFGLFCLLSSSVYIINDLSDLEADRKHPRKRLRPLASGQLSVTVARIALAVIVITVFPLAFLLSRLFFMICLVYFLTNLLYSIRLKHIPLLDIFALASFYVLRVVAGVELIHVTRFSPWLYIFATFLSLFLGVGKRRAELVLLENEADAHRKVLGGYSIPLLDQWITVVTTMTLATYSLYTFSAPNLPENHAMMLTIPFVIYGIFRYLYLIQIENGGGAPEDVLFSDRPLQVVIGMWGVAVLVVMYFL